MAFMGDRQRTEMICCSLDVPVVELVAKFGTAAVNDNN